MENGKGSAGWRCPFVRPPVGGRLPRLLPGLGEVVAERGEHHVFDALGAVANSETCGRQGSRGRVGAGVVSRPSILRKVGVLNAPLETALRSVVELVPE